MPHKNLIVRTQVRAELLCARRARIALSCIDSACVAVAFVALSALAHARRASEPTQDPIEAATVARIELAAPRHSPFLLRANVPVPKGAVSIEDAKTSLGVQSHASARPIVPAQVEIVSRYPTGEPDVVQVLAPVDLAPDERAGSRVIFDVVLAPQDLARTFPATDFEREVGAPPAGRFGVRTRDVHGNVYFADLSGAAEGAGFGSRRVLHAGPYEKQERIYATLVPIGTHDPARPPLAHLMGVHAYVTERPVDGVVLLDLRVNNGAVAGSREAQALESTLGIVYWQSLELVLPRGWEALAQTKDPFLGDAYEEAQSIVVPLVKPLPNGALHMQGPQAQFERRLALFRGGQRALAREANANGGLGFCMRGERMWSWFDPATARYFPQRDLLASVDFVHRFDRSGKSAVRAQEAADMRELRAGVETGTARGYYVEANVMGWAHPWFVKEQGGVGGEGIATVEGYYAAGAASTEGYTRLQLLHRMNVCRQSEAAYDRFGDVVAYHAWLDSKGKIPFDFRTNGGIVMPPFLLPMKGGPPASDQVREVVARGLRPPYDMGTPYEAGGTLPDRADNLLAWWPHDDQHLVRYTKNAKALVWLGNDAMAKDDLVLSAEMYRLMRHESPHVKASWSDGVTLRVWAKIVADNPHEGIWFGREDAWGIDAMCAAYSVATPEWRARQRHWFDILADLLDKGSLPCGLIQRMVNERLIDTKYTVAQCFECFFLIHAMRCMNESVFRGVDDDRRKMLETLAVRGIDYLCWGPPWAKQQASWQPDPAHPTRFLQGPRHGIAISLNDDYQSPPFSDEARWGANYMPPDGLGGGIEYFHPWAALSYAQEITDGTAGRGLDNRYLRRALDCGVAHENWRALVEDFADQAKASWSDNSANWIGLLGKLQSLGVR